MYLNYLKLLMFLLKLPKSLSFDLLHYYLKYH
jgi:hypothetical protein